MSQLALFENVSPALPKGPQPLQHALEPYLSQWFLPAWFSEILYDAHFSHLTSADLLWEPSVGTGSCVSAVPAHVPVYGTEISPRLAAVATHRTGRPITVGDLRNVALPDRITAIFGNPPSKMELVEAILARGATRMPQGSLAALVLPCSMFQTSSSVVRMNKDWTISQEMIPRDLFKNPKQMEYALTFGLFTRDQQPHLVGFRGYHETNAMRGLDQKAQRLFDESFQGPRSVWREVFTTVLRELGGTAHLSAIYNEVSGRRPTENPWWKEQLRKIANSGHFIRVAEGVYALPEAA